ncbi:MAG: alanine dehydrogenase [Desulforegulaceae bacterium]|nr:alanine dehydrogenase [Desulforegulaceae bacterium]
MIVGILKEIMAEENRVAMTPAGVEIMKNNGHKVLVEKNAGIGSGFSDEDYKRAGAEIVDSPKTIYEASEMIMHVKEPQVSEYEMIRKDQIFFAYFHFAGNESLTREMQKRRPVAIAYETIENPDGSLPLLTPMSEVAGKMSTQEAAKYLESAQGGRGVLMGGIAGVTPATVLVIGGGIVGTNAALMACGLGAQVYILDMNLQRLRKLSEFMPKNCFPLMSSPATIRDLAKKADAIIGAVLLPGEKAPKLIDEEILRTMKKGAVIVDVAIDQGGCFTTSRPTTHGNPTYEVEGIVHYCVPNMPGAVPRTSTMALTNATLPYAVEIANKGWKQAAIENDSIKPGINMVDGKITFKGVAQAFNLDYTPIENFL